MESVNDLLAGGIDKEDIDMKKADRLEMRATLREMRETARALRAPAGEGSVREEALTDLLAASKRALPRLEADRDAFFASEEVNGVIEDAGVALDIEKMDVDIALLKGAIRRAEGGT